VDGLQKIPITVAISCGKTKMGKEYCPVACNICDYKCVDDSSFLYKNVKTCKWITSNGLEDVESRCNIMWEGKLVKEYCPVTCNICDEKKCVDDPSFRFKGIQKKKCAWAARKAKKRCNKTWNGELVKHSCPVSCSSCGDVIII